VLENEYRIFARPKSINIIIPLPDNNATMGRDGMITVLVGAPKEYSGFFTKELYVHEYGHYLSFFDKNGALICPVGIDRDRGQEIEISRFDHNGDLQTKYLGALPYHFLPRTLLLQKEARDFNLYEALGELVADKIVFQLIGDSERKRFALRKIKCHYRKFAEGYRQKPYRLMHLLVLAKETGLAKEAKDLYVRVRQHESLWKQTISTEDLLIGMRSFFRSVSLKKQFK